MKTRTIWVQALWVVVIGGLGLTAGLAVAATFTWNQTGAGPYAWNDGANWLPAGDYPRLVDDVALLTGTLNANQTINLNTAITLARLQIKDLNTYYGRQFTIAGNGGSFVLSASGGPALVRHDQKGRFDIALPAADLISADVAVANNTIINANGSLEAGFGLFNLQRREGLELSGVVSGSGGLTKTGFGALWLNHSANTFQGTIAVRQGYLLPANFVGSLGNVTNTITLGAAGTIGHLAPMNSTVLSRPLTLTGAGGALHAPNGVVVTIGTTLTGNGSLLLGKGNGQIICTNAADNTFAGHTRVHGEFVDVTVSNRLFPSNVIVQYRGHLNLHSGNNVGGTVRVESLRMPTAALNIMASIGIKSNFFPNLHPASSGVISFEAHTGLLPAVNAAVSTNAPQLGNGYMHYGTRTQNTYFEGVSLQPNLDHVYRFTLFEQLSFSGPTMYDLNGIPHGVEVNGWPFVHGLRRLLHWGAAGNFSGPLTLNPGTIYSGPPSAIGANGGTVNLNGGILDLFTSTGTVSKATLNLQGQCGLAIGNAGITLTFEALNRGHRAVLGINCDSALGSTKKLIISNGIPSPVNGIVAPWLVHYAGDAFLSYDPASGFTYAAFTATNLAGAGARDIVDLAGGAVSGSQTVHALRVNAGVLTSGGPGDVLTIASGGLILDSSSASTMPQDHTVNLNFGDAEGVIYHSGRNGQYTCNQLSGRISGTAGLTIGAPIVGNYSPALYLTGSNTATLKGPITLNSGRLYVNSTSLGDPTNPVVINSCGTPRDIWSLGASLCVEGSVSIANPIILGPNGGAIGVDYGAFDLHGRISGPGGLIVWGSQPWYYATLYNPANDWSGGTWVVSGELYAWNGGRLGPGPVTVGGAGGRLYVNHHAAINPTSSVAVISSQFRDSDQIYLVCAEMTFGSLEGNGHVLFNSRNYAGNQHLTIGANGRSTDFFGNIKDLAPFTGYTGSVTKVGPGTFTLWGEGQYAGTTTVARGTLLVNGLLNGGKVTVNGGDGPAVLGGSGLIGNDGIRVINGGTLAPGALAGVLSVVGNVTLDATSTFEVDLNGTAAGSQYDQLRVTGGVDLGGCTLKVNLGYEPQIGDTFLILDNDGSSDAVTNRFESGRAISVSRGLRTYRLGISYTGGDGNDIVLTVLPVGTLLRIQ